MNKIFFLFIAVCLAGCAAALPELAGPASGQWRETCNLDMNLIAAAAVNYRARTGEFPARLDLLITGPDEWPDLWTPLLPPSVALEDPWGYPYRLQVPDRALAAGPDCQVISAGPDHIFATGDDLAQPPAEVPAATPLTAPGPAPSPAK